MHFSAIGCPGSLRDLPSKVRFGKARGRRHSPVPCASKPTPLRHSSTATTGSAVPPKNVSLAHRDLLCSFRCFSAWRDPCRNTHEPARLQEKHPALTPTHYPHLMTEAARRSNGASPDNMAESKETDKDKVAPDNDVSKAHSPAKSKPNATNSEAPAKPPKKRRKVNHGKPSTLCSREGVRNPANLYASM